MIFVMDNSEIFQDLLLSVAVYQARVKEFLGFQQSYIES